MWDEYTSSTEAVAIRTTYARLRDCLPNYVELGLVRYIDYANADLPSLNIFQRITHKNLPFKFENEMRGVATRPGVPELGRDAFDAAHFEFEARPGVTIFAPLIDLTRLVDGVVVHPEGTREFKAQMSLLCSENGLLMPEDSVAGNPVNRI